MSASVGEDAPTEDAIPGIHLLESSGDANRQEPEANLLSLLSIYRFPIKTSSWFGGSHCHMVTSATVLVKLQML